MTISVELLTTKEALTHCYLPWQLLLRQRKHFAWQSPRWWQFWLDHSAVGLPYWAIVNNGNSVIGMVHLARSGRSKSTSVWSLQLCPIWGGGVIGGQTTAVLNAVIGQLSRHPNRLGWELDYDPDDYYLKNRFELAFQAVRLDPVQATAKVIGWSFENSKPGNNDEPVFSDKSPTHGNVLWVESAIGCNDVYLTGEERSELLLRLEDSEVEWMQLRDGLFLAFWDFSTTRVLAGTTQVSDQNTWLPCCLVDCLGRARKDCARIVVEQLMPCFVQSKVRKCLLSDSLDHWLRANTEVDWPVVCREYGVNVKRWLMQHRKFERPNLWRRIQKGIARGAATK